ncbi:MAG: HD domain-containing phosphohydrolase [Thermoguttaceae bacterium]|jgi:HD-GYP domain-containing protein (c-di-GMP phosphodiesterase class II)
MQAISTEMAVDSRGLVPVAITTLQAQEEISFDLYLWSSNNRPPRLYRKKHVPLEPGDLQHLLDASVTTLYTRSSEAQQYCEHLRNHVLADETIAAKERYCVLKDATRAVLMASLEKGDVDGVLNVSGDLGRDMVTLVCDRKNILDDLLTVMTHDYSTFTHITNVSTFCIVLAEAYGIRDHAQLMEIAQGALLHDVGKCYIPAKLLNKATRLTQDEKEVIRQHPVRGFEELCMRADRSWGQLMMIYQHHERYDGRGYPVGLVGKEIHEWGRICAVADVYDALTRDRPYRKGASTKDVLEYMDRESGRGFDEEICQCWIATLKQCQR